MQPDKAGTAPAFPAGHLAGAKADRAMATKDGLTAWEAIERLFPEPEPEPELERSGLLKSDLELWSGGTTWVDRGMWWINAVSSFQDLLREGSWYAKGARVPVDPTPRLVHIQPSLWDILGLDPDNDTASGGGLEYAGLRFYETGKVASQKRGHDDVLLIEGMHELIVHDQCSVTDAATRLAPKASGGSTEESKAKRLERKYIQKYRR